MPSFAMVLSISLLLSAVPTDPRDTTQAQTRGVNQGQGSGRARQLAAVRGWDANLTGGNVAEHVDDLVPDRVYSRTSAFTAARSPMVIEWTLTSEGAVSGLVVRPAEADSGTAVKGEP